jgi:hypothetical protein
MDGDDEASALVAIGLGAADIVEDPVPVGLTLGLADQAAPQPTQPLLADLVLNVAEELSLPVPTVLESSSTADFTPVSHPADVANHGYSGNFATALVDSPLDAEWCFTTTAYTA